MSRILLADHSPHAQRMGERILRDEGYEVVTVTDGETALLRLKDLAPDLILADIMLPGRNGYEVCEYVKTSGKYPQTRVVLTAGPVAAFEEARAQTAGSDGFVRKPFEASLLLNTVQPLIEKPDKPAAPRREPGLKPELKTVAPPPAPVVQPPRPIDREQVRAAVILALEASMITMIENITDKVVQGLEADARSEVAARAKASAAVAQAPAPQPRAAQAAAATLGTTTPVGRPAETKAAPVPAPEEPVVRIRTPIFRTLS